MFLQHKQRCRDANKHGRWMNLTPVYTTFYQIVRYTGTSYCTPANSTAINPTCSHLLTLIKLYSSINILYARDIVLHFYLYTWLTCYWKEDTLRLAPSLVRVSVLVWVVCVPQEAGGNAAQTWAEGEDYSRKTLFVALFHHDVMSVPLSSCLITILNEPPCPRIPHYRNNKRDDPGCNIC